MIETALRRLGSPEWWKHLRPANKRLANRFIRRNDRALIAEFDDPQPRKPWELDEDECGGCMNCRECGDRYCVPEATRGMAYTVDRYWLCPGCRKAWAKVVI